MEPGTVTYRTGDPERMRAHDVQRLEAVMAQARQAGVACLGGFCLLVLTVGWGLLARFLPDVVWWALVALLALLGLATILALLVAAVLAGGLQLRLDQYRAAQARRHRE